MNLWRATVQVVVDLVVGDDPKIALSVVSVLAVVALAVVAGMPAGVITVGGAVLVAAAFAVSLLLDVRR